MSATAGLQGRTTPPTAEEMRVHHAAGGCWLVRFPWRGGSDWSASVIDARDARDEAIPGAQFVALDSQRRPCPWPEVKPSAPRAPGCKTVGPCAYCDDPERAR